MLAGDFFVVDTVWLTQLYVLFGIGVKTRVVHLLGVARPPSGLRATQVARNLVADFEDQGRFFQFPVRDRDSKFTTSFGNVFASAGARVIKCPVREPRANAFAERWVGTARRECTDHRLILGRCHLEVVLRLATTRPDKQVTARPPSGQSVPRTAQIQPLGCREIALYDILGSDTSGPDAATFVLSTATNR